MAKRDPYKHEEKYRNWQERVLENGIPDVSKTNSDLILKYIHDMEHGLNVSRKSKKGGRSFIRLNTLREKIIFFSKRFSEVYGLEDIRKINEEQLGIFFSKMRNGEIPRLDGKPYKGVSYFAKTFKAFWHWHMNVNRKQDIEIKEITWDLDTKDDKPKWVYLTEKQVRKLSSNCRLDYRTLIMFLYDTGMRVTEAFNIQVKDFSKDFKEVMVREEVSKTFGRRIKLMLSSELVKEYVSDKGFKVGDYIFPAHTTTANKYIKRMAKKLFGEEESLAGDKFSNLTMYDFRHCSCCYWLPRYPNESGLKYRFGWKKSDKIFYYSEFLGMSDTIAEADIILPEDKKNLDGEIKQLERKYQMVSEENIAMLEEMKMIKKLVLELGKKIV